MRTKRSSSPSFSPTYERPLAKNFGVSESAFANLPKEELYIFQSTVPGPLLLIGSSARARCPRRSAIGSWLRTLSARTQVRLASSTLRLSRARLATSEPRG
jgi:oxalate decarboxylase